MRHRILWTTGIAFAAVWVASAAGRASGDDRERRAVPTVRQDSLRNFELKDLDGRPHALLDLRGTKLVVLSWTEPGCPVAKVYAPRVAALAKEYEAKSVKFLGVVSGAEADAGEAKRAAADAGTPFPVLRDPEAVLAQRLGVETTTAVVVLDENRRVRYRGAVDDQYGVNGRKAEPTKRWLVDALESLLEGKAPAVAATAAPGCPLDLAAKTAAPAYVTWNASAGAIVQRRCATCHREGEAAPFPLVTFADAKKRVATMRDAVTAGRMPPWHALGEPGLWANDRRLDPKEKDTLLSWLGGGAAEGTGAAPVAPGPTTADGWEMGKPDAVFTFATPQAVPAEGVVPYRFVEVPTDYAEDRWFNAVEVRPGAPQVVHHVLVAVSPGKRGRHAAFAPTNGFLAAMVPGGRSQRFSEGTAKRLPAHATLLFQLHYTPNGVAAEDATSIGFKFLKHPPRQEVHTVGAFNATFKIPPGEGNWEVPSAPPLPVLWDVHVLAYMPHMHVRGKAFRYSYKVMGGEEKTLCEVPVYDFNWQTPYRLTTPVAVPKGSLFKATGWFDNSDKNPYNPDPTAEVRWGDQTWDEMMIGYVDFVIDGEDLTKPKPK